MSSSLPLAYAHRHTPATPPQHGILIRARVIRSAARVLALATVCLSAGFAQAGSACPSPSWIPGVGMPGLLGKMDPFGGFVAEVNTATMWDRDGAGPLAPQLVVGGTFSFAGSERAEGVATWNGAAWEPVGTGAGMSGGPVLALATTSTGVLYAGGFFGSADGTPVQNLARFTGGAWTPVGSGIGGVDGVVTDLVVRPNGHLIIGGTFSIAGVGAQQTLAANIVRWNGSAFAAIGLGISVDGDGSGAGVNGLSLASNGDVIVTGSFNQAGAVTGANNIARVNFGASGNAANWTTLGAGLTSTTASVALGGKCAVLSNGDIVAGGSFDTAGTVPALNIARWNGTTWSAFADGLGASADEDTVVDVIQSGTGQVIAVGRFSSSGATQLSGVALWNGTSWAPLGTIADSPISGQTAYAIVESAPGRFDIGGPFANAVTRWSAGAWSFLGAGFDDSVLEFASAPDGTLIAGGRFTHTPHGAARHIARWNGSTWSPIGAGFEAVPRAILPLPGGDIVVAGVRVSGFTAVGVEVRRWNGATWSLMGSDTLADGMSGFALARLNNGDIVAAGNRMTLSGRVGGVYRWTGTDWVLLGGAFSNNGGFAQPNSLVVLPNGDLVAGGSFDTPAANVARWNGSSWSAMGAGLGDPLNFESVSELALSPSGQLVAAGQFISDVNFVTIFDNVARWDGTAWQPMGAGFPDYFPFYITAAPDGSFTIGGAIPNGVQRWDGSSWAPVSNWVEGTISDVHAHTDGTLSVGGDFVRVGSLYDSNTMTFSGGVTSARVAFFGCEPPACIADFNGVGGVTVQDIFDFLAAWFANLPSADVNGAGGVTVQDIFDFLSAWFVGCP